MISAPQNQTEQTLEAAEDSNISQATNLSESIAILARVVQEQEQASEEQLTLRQYVKLVELLKKASWRVTIEQKLALTKDQVLQAVVDLGVWLGQSKGGKDAVKVPISTDPQGQDAQGNSVLFATVQPTDRVIVPIGFEKTSPKDRDVSKGLANIVVHSPDREMLKRFMIRKSNATAWVLTYSIVAALHDISQTKLAHRVHEGALRSDGTYAPELSRMLVKAYEYLEVARIDAQRSIAELVTPGIENDLDAVIGNCIRARWVDQRQLDRIRVTAEALKPPENEDSVDKGEPLHNGDLRSLVRLLSLMRTDLKGPNSLLRIDSISRLTKGQVQRICQTFGLPTALPSRSEEKEIRNWIEKAGLSADNDQLMPAMVLAWRAGLDTVAKLALRRRANGRMDWNETLNQKLKEVGVARHRQEDTLDKKSRYRKEIIDLQETGWFS